MNNFEEFLQEKHAENYTGTDDDMPDSFDHWLVELDYEDWLRYGEEFNKQQLKKLIEDAVIHQALGPTEMMLKLTAKWRGKE